MAPADTSRADQTVLVTGATGQQGGATARRMLADGWPVRALVRDPSSPAAEALVRAGAKLVRGDMDDRASLDAAVKGAYGVFSVQPAGGAPELIEAEVRLGCNVADAAHAAGVRHFVYSSVGGADRDSGISHWETKWLIEQHIRKLGLPATILRPVMFMENHADPDHGVLGETALIRRISPHATVQMIAVTDIGAFAALAFAHPATYLGKAIEIAGDELTGHELVAAISQATGHPITGDALPLPPETQSFGGWQADIPALRTLHPGLMDFDSWLATEGKAKLKALFATRPA
ncbi:NmrA/HSCARG family protein [Actinopolymorpha sp. B9G3]|uniref:NmrA/HSCARG family protein n=1 Tax=Actinopolymorpha sp. B9G3 TaxID=3158970 RepID=UPI0032D8F2DE